MKRIIKREFSRNQQHAINVIASIVNMIVGALISFFLTPYIVKNIGVEANGFVSLANNFIGYAIVASIALNSMSGRFIMMEMYNNNSNNVLTLYSSLFWANFLLAILYVLVGSAVVYFLDYLIIIPDGLVLDVKILFSLLFLSTIILTISSAWSITPYIKNKLYLDSINSLLQTVLRAIFIFLLFAFLPPTVSIVGIGALASVIIGARVKYLYKSVLLPWCVARLKYFSWKSIRLLLSSGVWNSISSLGNILTSGLDLLVANIFVGPKAMGLLAIAKVLPEFISTLNYSIANVFTPSLIIDYAHSQKSQIVKTINQSSKLITVICTIPLSFLFIFGFDFYRLWQPTEDSRTLFILSSITIFGRVFFTGMQPLFNVFTVVNKVKENSLVTIFNGCVIIIVTLFCVKFTSLGIYAVAGVSVFFCFVKNILFVVPFSAKYLGLNKNAFWSTIWPSVYSTIILCTVGLVLRLLVGIYNWFSLLSVALIFTAIGLCLTVSIVLNREERRLFVSFFQKFRKNCNHQ